MMAVEAAHATDRCSRITDAKMAAEEEMAADAAEATNLEAADGSQRQQMERWSDGA